MRLYFKEYLNDISLDKLIEDAKCGLYSRIKNVLKDIFSVIEYSVSTDKGKSFDQLLDKGRVDELER